MSGQLERPKKSMVKVLLVIVVLSLVVAFLYHLNISQYFSLDVLKAKSGELREMVDRSYVKFVVTFCVAYALVVALMLPAVIPFSLLAGYLFGVWLGSLYSLIAAVSGCIITFMVIRYGFNRLFRERYPVNSQRA